MATMGTRVGMQGILLLPSSYPGGYTYNINPHTSHHSPADDSN